MMNVLFVASFAACFVTSVFPAVRAASGSFCYHNASCNDATWPTTFARYCNGTRQSPIDINTTLAQGNANLTAFTFTGYSNDSNLYKIKNTGSTVKVYLKMDGMSVEGGDLSGKYNSLQFHLHWGNGSSVPGSEHTVDGKRYPMELHIVNLKSEHNGNLTSILADSTGLAALGFFIDVLETNETGTPDSWKTLTSYLANITNKDDYANITHKISMDDLLVGVDRTKYYRYLGSLTTPSCNEAVVWTVFKDPIRISKDLIDLFSTTVFIDTTSSTLMSNVYRSVQDLRDRTVMTQVSSTVSSSTNPLQAFSMGVVLLYPMLRVLGVMG